MRPPQIRLYDEVCADLFAGGGGTSTGIEAALGRSPDLAINHDPQALAMHAANHPLTRHLCESVHDVDPKKATGGKPVGFAWFSPDCTFHSKARGGKPHRDRNRARRIRGLAWVAVRWALAVKPRVLFVENVEEFKDWGPLTSGGVPDQERKGQTFSRWVARLRNLGYAVEWKELRACDFGAPTSRKRLFVVARCDGKPIVWPAPTHGPRRKPYRTAAECIDWSLPVPSIFLTPAEAREWARTHGTGTPKRPLSENTLRRIARGVQRFVIDAAEPFIVRTDMMRANAACSYSTHEPLRTMTTAPGFALVAPTLIQTSYGERKGQAPRILNLHEPLGTVVAGGVKHGLVAAFLAKHNGGHEATGQRCLEPIAAVTTRDQKALVAAHILKLYGTCQDGAPVDAPLPTITANGKGGGHLAEVRAFLVKFYSAKEGQHQDLRLPLDTITTKDRFGLVTIRGEDYAIVDIGMRMLTPRELFRCQGFPEEYQIAEVAGGQRLPATAQVRMVGNSVPPPAAAAIVAANYLEAA